MTDPRNRDLAPETENSDNDEQSQAQSVAEEAIDRATSVFGLEDSEKVGSGDENDDVQDLVDHMRQMDSSGIIDMSAFRGERNDDDEEDSLGTSGIED